MTGLEACITQWGPGWTGTALDWTGTVGTAGTVGLPKTQRENELEAEAKQLKAIRRVSNWVLKKLADGPLTTGVLNKKLDSRARAWLRPALDALETEAQIKQTSQGWQLMWQLKL